MQSLSSGGAGTSTSNLELLNLYGNMLSGSIPDDFFTSAPLLTTLVLSVNQLTGTVPTTLGNLNDIEIFDIDGNYFSGTIPSEVSQLTNLRSLQLNDNSFTGSLPNLHGLARCTDLGFPLNDEQVNVPDESKLPSGLWVLKDQPEWHHIPQGATTHGFTEVFARPCPNGWL